jgi:hypothetical protein
VVASLAPGPETVHLARLVLSTAYWCRRGPSGLPGGTVQVSTKINEQDGQIAEAKRDAEQRQLADDPHS